jgi:hypothetical protein
MNKSFFERQEVKSLLGSVAKTGFAFAEQWLERQRAAASARATSFAESARRVQSDTQREISRMAANASDAAQSVALPAFIQPSKPAKNQDQFPVSLFAGLVMGGLAGAVAALLYAPQSGKTTRGKIQREAHKLQNSIFDYAENLGDKTSANVSDLKDTAADAASAIVEKFQFD